MDADYRSAAAIYGPRAVALLEDLECDLTPAQWARVWDLTNVVDEACSAHGQAAHARDWELLKAHLPGLACVLEMVRNHTTSTAARRAAVSMPVRPSGGYGPTSPPELLQGLQKSPPSWPPWLG